LAFTLGCRLLCSRARRLLPGLLLPCCILTGGLLALCFLTLCLLASGFLRQARCHTGRFACLARCFLLCRCLTAGFLCGRLLARCTFGRLRGCSGVRYSFLSGRFLLGSLS
jgi:hypothetical protein